MAKGANQSKGTVVEVPGRGNVQFPPEMSREEIQKVLNEQRTEDSSAFIPEGLQKPFPEGQGFGGRVEAVGSASASLARQAAAEPAAGIAGLYELGKGYISGSEDPIGAAVERIEEIRSAIGGEGPESEAGKAFMENLTGSHEKALFENAKEVGDEVLRQTGSPEAATGARVVMEFVPSILGGKRQFNVREKAKPAGVDKKERAQRGIEITGEPDQRARRKDFQRFKSIIKGQGVDLRSRKSLFDSLERIAKRTQGFGKANSMNRVARAVRRGRDAEKKIESTLWQRAREGAEGRVDVDEIREFRDTMGEALDGFVIEDMPKVRRLLGRFDESLEAAPSGSQAKISALQRWRKAINKNMPSDKMSPEAVALNTMKRNLDTFLENKYMTDMIKGDPESLTRWREAIDQTSKIKKTFDDDRIIRKFVDKDVTAEELRSFLFNSSSVGAKDASRRVIKRLKRILGPDGEEMRALRHESMFNLVQPLLKETPDFAGFNKKYEEFVTQNPGLIKELFPKESQEALRLTNAAAKQAKNLQSFKDRIANDAVRAPFVLALGHGIAKAGLKVRLGKKAADQILQAENTSMKSQIAQDVLGYNPAESMFRDPLKRTAAINAVTQATEEDKEDDK